MEAEGNGTLADPATEDDVQQIEGQTYFQPALSRRAVFPAVVRDRNDGSDGTDASTGLDLADFDEFVSKEAQLESYVEETVAFLACH